MIKPTTQLSQHPGRKKPQKGFQRTNFRNVYSCLTRIIKYYRRIHGSLPFPLTIRAISEKIRCSISAAHSALKRFIKEQRISAFKLGRLWIIRINKTYNKPLLQHTKETLYSNRKNPYLGNEIRKIKCRQVNALAYSQYLLAKNNRTFHTEVEIMELRQIAKGEAWAFKQPGTSLRLMFGDEYREYRALRNIDAGADRIIDDNPSLREIRDAALRKKKTPFIPLWPDELEEQTDLESVPMKESELADEWVKQEENILKFCPNVDKVKIQPKLKRLRERILLQIRSGKVRDVAFYTYGACKSYAYKLFKRDFENKSKFREMNRNIVRMRRKQAAAINEYIERIWG